MKRITWKLFSSPRRRTARSSRVQLERLEPRVVLAGDLVLAEVMTSNEDTIDDEDGVPSDWFEIYNAGNQTVDLTGWFVTDDVADRTQWQIPGGTLAPGQTLLVFASGKDKQVVGRPLHTNFRLAEGDYLALFEPDGRTLAHAYESLPTQYEDIGYGIGQTLVDRLLVGADAARQARFPSSSAEDVPTATWTSPDFDGSSWATVGGGVGYDDDLADGDFNPLISATGNVNDAMRGKTASAYLRSEFTLPDVLPTFKTLDLTVNYDDGFIAYLNGQEITRVNAPEAAAWDATATGQHGGIEALFGYASFASADDRDDFTLKGNAQWTGDRLALTTPAAGQTSAVWRTQPVRFGPDYTFSTAMVYDIHTPGGTFADGDRDGLGGEGITFTLQANSEQVLGVGGGGLGLDNTGSTFLSIELDSIATGSWDPDDSLPSHLGINTSTDGSVARVGLPRFNGNGLFPGEPGPGVNLIYLWVDYAGETGVLDVYMALSDARPAAPTLSTTLDMAELFGAEPELFAGWTSATSAAFNGHDVLSWNMTTGVGQLGREAVSFNVSNYVDLLRPGTNVLAIHGLNVAADDEDFLFRAQLTTQEVEIGEVGYFLTPTPGDLNGTSTLAPSEPVTFSQPSTIYVEPFNLEIIPPSPGATIYYTLDGSIPDETSLVYTEPLAIDGPMRVRARAVQEGRSLSAIETAGFTQLDDALVNFENGEVFSSNLPLMVFEGFGDSPDRQTRRLVPTVAYVISPGADGKATLLDEPDYVGRAGLRSRGQSSEGWPKKQYALEFWAEGNDDSSPLLAADASDQNVSLFGLPADSDWVLNGPYADKTQLNNYLTFNWYNKLGLYAPRTYLVEVFVNPNGSKLDFASDYRGTYVLLEKIKIDQNRVNIQELQPGDVDDDVITGGYIWKKDKAGAGDRPFNTSQGQQLRMVEPQDPVSRDDIRPGEITDLQRSWLQSHINEFEAALYGPDFADPRVGYAKYIDVDSWVDTWLMVEMTKNIDGFRLSTYYHKDRGGKIHQGPAWDYNLSLANGNYLQGAFPVGWYKDAGLSSADYPYWDRLFEDPNFAQKVADRWGQLRQTTFTTENIMADIDAAVNLLSNGNPNLSKPAEGEPSNPISRNYARWTTGGYGEAIYHWPNCFFGVDNCPPSPLPAELSPNGRPNSYDDYIYIMKWFLENRLAWMDTQFAPPLDATPRGGPVEAGTQVTITGPTGYDIYYTLDGTDPRVPLIIEEEAIVLDTGGQAQALVPVDGSLMNHCDDGLRLTNPAACFINVGYQPGANGETWTNVTMPIGYDTDGDYAGLIGTDVQELLQNNNSSIYLRIPFDVPAEVAANGSKMKLSARYDDGFVAYLWFNTLSTPVEIARANAGTSSSLPIRPLEFNAAADQTHPDELAVQYQEFDVSGSLRYLRGGQTNYLVIQALNENAGSNDFLMDFRLSVGTERVEVNPSVLRYEGPVTIDRNSHIIARGFDANRNQWTAPSIQTYVVDAPLLAITEINYNPYEPTASELAVSPNLQNNDFEFVELKNIGTQTINLVGLKFDGFDLTLGNVELAPGQYGVVVQDAAAFALRYGNDVAVLGEFFGGALSNQGEALRLLDPFDNVLVEVEYDDSEIWPQSADGNGASLQLVNPDTTPGDQLGKYYSWQSSLEYGGSPGRAGAEKIGIVINEVLANPNGGGTSDSIELLNVSNQPIDISGWYLSDSAAQLNKYAIPAGTIVAPGQYVVFNASQFNADPNNGFGLSGYEGDDVYLSIFDAQGNPQSVVADVHFGPSLAGESFGRDANGWFVPQLSLTLGSANASPRVGPVVLSEIQYSPAEPTAADLAIDPTLLSGDLEFVEIYNPTASTVDFTDWRIRGGIEYNFHPNTLLAPGEVIVVVRFDPNNATNAVRLAAFRNHYQLDDSVRLVGGYVQQLSGNGERVTLLRPDTSITDPIVLPHVQEDEVIYDDRLPWPGDASGTGNSLTRNGPALYGSDGQSWVAAPASPGRVSYEPSAGDFDGDGLINVTDITLLFEQLRSATPDTSFDLNGDGQVDAADRDVLILDILGTTYGDTTLDKVFEPHDLVLVFQRGHYDAGIPGGATWADGDWNGDGVFDSNDLLLAAQSGGYVGNQPQPLAALDASGRVGVISALEVDRVLSELSDTTEKKRRDLSLAVDDDLLGLLASGV